MTVRRIRPRGQAGATRLMKASATPSGRGPIDPTRDTWGRLSRRRWLQGVGVSLALPMFARDAEAKPQASDDAASTQRMVCVANPLGFVPQDFFPTEAGELPKGKSLPPLLRPLAAHRDRFSVLSEFDHGVSGGHQGVHSFLSGIRDNESSSWANRNVSLDQIAAEHTVGQVRFPSLVAAVGQISGELECRTSWTRTGVNVPPVTEANTLFRMLFAQQNATERAQLRKAIAENTSVLDAVSQQAGSLSRTLGPADRRKLDEYLTSVRSVEKNLANVDAWVDRPKPQVSLAEPGEGEPFTKRLPVFYELIALALQTDSTRVATLAIPGNLPVSDLGLSGNYHAFSHHGKSDRLLKPLHQIERYQIAQFAAFLGRLRELQTPDGRPLLDSTMVLCGSGMGNASSHSNKNLPLLVAGGRFRHGQHIVGPSESHKRIPLCNVYTAMLQRFGCRDVDRFNRATGSMTELFA